MTLNGGCTCTKEKENLSVSEAQAVFIILDMYFLMEYVENSIFYGCIVRLKYLELLESYRNVT